MPVEYLIVHEPRITTVGVHANALRELDKVFQLTIDPTEEPQDILENLSDYASLILAIEKSIPAPENQLVGFGLLWQKPETKIFELHAAFVQEKFRGQKYSSRIIDLLISDARDLGATVLLAVVGASGKGMVDGMLKRRGFISQNSEFGGDYHLRF
jgi:GNAT superfamily N-acetyltransferase